MVVGDEYLDPRLSLPANGASFVLALRDIMKMAT